MQPIQFTGHNMEITEALRTFATNKFSKLEHFSDRLTSLQVIFSVDKNRQLAEANLHIPGAEINAKAESEDMYKTIDKLIDKLVTQLKKHRYKETSHRE